METYTVSTLGLRALRHVCVFVFLASGTAHGDLIPITQTRTLDTLADESTSNPDLDSDHAEAIDFGPFLESIRSDASGGGALSNANADQNSQITAAGFSAIGSSGALATGENDTAHPTSSGRSVFALTFELTAPGSVSGTLDAQASGGLAFPLATMTIPGVGSWSTAGPLTPVSVNLPAGSYSIEIRANTQATSMNFDTALATASFDIQLVPEPATLLLLVGGVGLLRRRR